MTIATTRLLVSPVLAGVQVTPPSMLLKMPAAWTATWANGSKAIAPFDAPAYIVVGVTGSMARARIGLLTPGSVAPVHSTMSAWLERAAAATSSRASVAARVTSEPIGQLG